MQRNDRNFCSLSTTLPVLRQAPAWSARFPMHPTGLRRSRVEHLCPRHHSWIYLLWNHRCTRIHRRMKRREQSIAQEAEVQAFLPNLPLPASGDLFNSLFQHIEDVVASQNTAAGDVTRTEATQESLIEETFPEPRTSFGNFSVSMSHLLQEMESLILSLLPNQKFSPSTTMSNKGKSGRRRASRKSTLSREALLKSPEQRRSLIERMPHSLARSYAVL